MNIEIKKLTPELLKDYLHFFDTTPHDTNKPEDRCYCVGWCNANTKSDWFLNVNMARGIWGVHLIKKWQKLNLYFVLWLAPKMKRKGIAEALLKRVCEDSLQDDFEFCRSIIWQ